MLTLLFRYANCAAWFMSAYIQGLSSAEAVWANKKYHSHHTLLPKVIAEIKREYMSMYEKS